MATFYDLPNNVIIYLFNNFTDITTITISRFVNKNLNELLSNDKNKDKFLNGISSLSTIEWYFQPTTTLPYIQNNNFNLIIKNVIRNNNLEFIKEIINKYIIDINTIVQSLTKDNVQCVKYLLDSKRTNLIDNKKAHLDDLIYAYENGCKFNSFHYSIATEYNSLECFKFIHKCGILFDEHVSIYAAYFGWRLQAKSSQRLDHLEILQYAHENGCEWDERTCSAAAENGHLKCLKYAHQNGCQ